MDTITVKAVAGLCVPREDNHRTYITEAEVVTVPTSAYYLRRLNEGDLVQVEPPKPKKPSKSEGEQ